MKEFKLGSDILSRRNFLKMTAAGTVAAIGAQSGILGTRKDPESGIPIALQLYSVRGDCAQDFDRAMAQVADMGYRGVEFAGYYHYGDDPRAYDGASTTWASKLPAPTSKPRRSGVRSFRKPSSSIGPSAANILSSPATGISPTRKNVRPWPTPSTPQPRP